MNDQIFESHGWVFDRGWHRRPLQIKRGKIMVQLSHVLLLCTLEVWDVEETLFQIEVHLKLNFVKKTFSVSKISTLKKVQFWNAKGDILILSWISWVRWKCIVSALGERSGRVIKNLFQYCFSYILCELTWNRAIVVRPRQFR